MQNGKTDTKLEPKDIRINAAISAVMGQRDMYSTRCIQLEMDLAEAKAKIEELEGKGAAPAEQAKPATTEAVSEIN